ncbi:hypothetical protein BHE74_00028347 [Ensete ventricosum]|nr:hypothetical protein BHE74_00028347 [Ensete ventricosum]
MLLSSSSFLSSIEHLHFQRARLLSTSIWLSPPGGYDMEEKAARAYDLAALKYWGTSTHINFMVRRSTEAYDIAAIKFRGLNAVTNFDISRYEVEKIMASSTLLAGELARRNKNVEPSAPTSNRELNLTADNITSSYHQSTNQASPIMPQEQNQKLITTSAGFPNEHLASNLHGVVSMNASAQGIGDSANLVTTAPGMNPSFLFTSLSSSREGSPDRTDISMLFAKTPPKLISPTPLHSWMPSTQLRSALPLSHMPVFAAWTDA